MCFVGFTAYLMGVVKNEAVFGKGVSCEHERRDWKGC